MTDDDDMIIVITVSCRKAFLYFGFYWDSVGLLQCGIQRQKPLTQTLLIFCSVAFREKKPTHSDTVDLLQCGIQKQKPLIQTLLIFCSVAFRNKSHSFRLCWSFAVWHSETKATLSDTVDLLHCGNQKQKPLIQALLIFYSVACGKKGCTAGGHSGAVERTAQEGAARVEAEYPPIHHPAGCPTTKPT